MKKNSILIAEDDADDRFLLKKAFEENNSEQGSIQFVENGLQVLAYLQKIQTERKTYPTLIILDLNMPEKDGKEVLREIKENEAFKSIPVIVLTTSGNETVINRCYALGANSYIKKPIHFDDLLQVVERIKAYWMQTVSLPA